MKRVSPFKATTFIAEAPIVHIEGGFYLIAGYTENSSYKQIARLDAVTMQWSDAGKLATNRFWHNAIYDGVSLLVVGGDGIYKTEVCSLSNETFTCVEQNPELTNYDGYPELFLVEDEYCKE